MESAAEKQPVRVTILSRSYVLRTADDPRQVEALATSVNDLMLSIASRAPNADSTHIAVLACLHLADKLRLLEHDLSSLKERVDRKSGEFAAHARPVDPRIGRRCMMARILLALLLAVRAMFAASSYQSEIAAGAATREAKLKAEDGWLSLAGLFWLHEGANPFGKDAGGEIVLPDGPATCRHVPFAAGQSDGDARWHDARGEARFRRYRESGPAALIGNPRGRRG